MRVHSVELGKKFQDDLKSIGNQSGPLPVWLWKKLVSDDYSDRPE